MIRGYAAVKGNLRRPRKGATVYKRPELAVVFGAKKLIKVVINIRLHKMHAAVAKQHVYSARMC